MLMRMKSIEEIEKIQKDESKITFFDAMHKHCGKEYEVIVRNDKYFVSEGFGFSMDQRWFEESRELTEIEKLAKEMSKNG